LGVAQYRAGDWRAAEEALEKACEMQGGKDPAHLFFLAMTYWQLGRRDEALRDYDEAATWLEEKTRGEDQYRFRDEAAELISPEMIVRYWTGKIADDPQSSTWYLQRATAYAQGGEYDAAATDFVQAMELGADGRWNASTLAFRELVRAEPVFARVAELRPDDTPLWRERGRYYALRRQWERAVADYGRVIKDAEPDVEYAALLVLTGDHDAYIKLCHDLQERLGRTDQPGMARELAVICSLGPQSGTGSARIVEQAQLALSSGQNKFTLQALAQANYRDGKLSEAVRLVQEAMALPEAMPKSEAAFPLALAYRGLGQEEESRKWYQIGVAELERITPQNQDDPVSWAPVHWLGVNVWYREARTAFESANPQTPKNEESVENEEIQESSRP
jgi:tetratricopeptide (TPR) repeat protein